MPFALNSFSRRVAAFCSGMALVCLLPVFSLAQDAPAPVADTSHPVEASDNYLQREGAQPRFDAASKLSSAARTAVSEGRISSVPYFSGSFALQGSTYPYTIVGGNPKDGATTKIPVQIIPISLYFEEFVDDKGTPIVLDPASVVQKVRKSPNFEKAPYATGTTQFADAVQRAQFYGSAGKEWHTLLGAPSITSALRIVVPRGDAKVFRNPDTGALFAIVDTDHFLSHLNTIIQMANLEPNALTIVLTKNIFLAPQSDIKKCCVLGFHTSFDMGELAQVKFVQTFIWASWVDQGLLGSSLADVTPLSHEISEWMNNPFGTNMVPAWQVPNATGCQSNLETGDPLALMPTAGYPVTIDGFTYHPQSQVMMQWFQRGSTSDAFEGAFSFPDQSLMTQSAQACSTH